MEYITPTTMLIAIFALHLNGVQSAHLQSYVVDDAAMEPISDNSPMNYVPEEVSQEEMPHMGEPEEMQNIDKLPEIIIPEEHHRRGKRKCKDKKGEKYCYKILLYGHCLQRRQRRRCRKSCGDCEDKRECKDTGRNCMYASVFTCSQGWYARGCLKSCNLCETGTTTQPITTTTTKSTTTEPGQECKDSKTNCENANKYSCSYFWMRWGCRKSCGLCVPETTTTAPSPPETSSTTIATTEPSTSSSSTTSSSAMTTTTIVPSSTPTTTIATTEPSTSSSSTTTSSAMTTTTIVPSSTPTTTIVPSSTPTTTIATRPTTNPEATSEPKPTTTKPDVIKTTTKVSTTLGSRATDATSEQTQEPLLCVDQDEKNCHIWASLGLCYNPKFMKDTMEICPLSCQVCDPEDFLS